MGYKIHCTHAGSQKNDLAALAEIIIALFLNIKTMIKCKLSMPGRKWAVILHSLFNLCPARPLSSRDEQKCTLKISCEYYAAPGLMWSS